MSIEAHPYDSYDSLIELARAIKSETKYMLVKNLVIESTDIDYRIVATSSGQLVNLHCYLESVRNMAICKSNSV